MLYNGVEVQTIKLVLSGTESTGISSKQVLLNCIVYLTEKYRESREFSYLEKAVWHMYAYLELGFSYADGEEIFQTVLDFLCLTREEVFPIQYFGKKVALNKSAIRKILGKWNPKLHSMKVSEAVNDILGNIKNKNTGTYIYHSGKIISKSDNENLWEKTFKLYIQEDAILYDVNKKEHYTF